MDIRAALKRVSDQRDLLMTLINQVPDQLFVKDLESRFLIANGAVVADKTFIATGEAVTVEALIGKTDFDLFAAPIAQQFHDAEVEIMRSGHPVLSTVEQNVYADGGTKWVSMTKAPLRNVSGQIIGLIGLAQDVTKRKEMEDQARFMAHHDILTGLPNRGLVISRIDEALAQATQNGSSVAVVFLDLDNFKWVNDTLGHQAGDDVLKTAASRIAGSLRLSDIAGRFGGDEFVIILRDPPRQSDGLIRLLERVRTRVAEPLQLAGQTVCVTTSIGVALLETDGTTRDELLAKADAAMYRSKRNGRNTICLASQLLPG
ncbi:diguanylate cyclase (GGDEF)-like protein/PAS domain S-box-containing protein [Pararhizobium capsulatum DSM 1112]|uniref:Diguanylate cyclase (GGDEF)-like protein/PAS domain S-box-containing protein n=1 Tax=Pararhizobium capsulatum DSM 1112 TaxID=1121113 RepID=A0ABU0BXZ8_9HYPH|nr:GGDEF domain-containing protein [Pararhizobium capsulatum]MDQ0322802.1 diguanylate cyclase (GGDEF)-like protein/PAS domain S-box-containing protein [Pararhizobium capsulatum DSM 1112]